MAQRSATLALCLCLCGALASALTPPPIPKLIPEEVVDEFADLAQESQDYVVPPRTTTIDDGGTTADPNDEGCGGEELKRIVLEHMQTNPHFRCQQLNRDECLSFHEARNKCPCVCDRRKRYYNPEGVNRGDSIDWTDDIDPADYEARPHHELTSAEKAAIDAQNAIFQAGAESKPICFPAAAAVVTSAGVMSMAELWRMQLGVDRKQIDSMPSLLSYSYAASAFSMSPLDLWLHAEPATNATFLALRTELGAKLRLTANHIVHASRGCTGQYAMHLASAVRPGDCLVVQREGRPSHQRVTGVTSSRSQGIYAPVTKSGTVVVDGVVASCYANAPYERLQAFFHWLISASYKCAAWPWWQRVDADAMCASAVVKALGRWHDAWTSYTMF